MRLGALRATERAPRGAVRFAVVAGVLPVVGRLVVFLVFVFSVSPSGVCSVVSSRSGRRLSGGAVSVVARAVLAPVRLRSRVLRGACRSVRALRSRSVWLPAVWVCPCSVPAFAWSFVRAASLCSVCPRSSVCFPPRPRPVSGLSPVARASVWVCASLLGVRALPGRSVACFSPVVPGLAAPSRFAACRASLLAGVCRVRCVSVAPVPPSSPLPVWAAGSPLAGALPPLVPLSPASSGGSLLSLSLPSFRSAVSRGACPLRLLLSSFSWPVRSCVLWALARVLGSGGVAAVVGGAPFRAPALSFLVAGLRSLGFRSFAPSLVGSRAWCAAALRFLVRRCGVVVPPAVSSLSGRVSPAGLAAVFPALSAGLSRLSVRASGVSCPPALRPALSVCLFRLFLALFPPFGC